MQATTHPFIEYLRNQIRFAITRVQKELEETAAAKDQTANDAISAPGSQNAAEKNVQDDELDLESGDADGDESQNSSPKISESSSGAAQSSNANLISSKSKRITKKDSDQYWKHFGNRHPEKWQELHYLRETIKGREWELKLLKMQLKHKSSEFMAVEGPGSPTSLKKTKDILGEDI